MVIACFFFNDTATTEIYTLSLHDALPISRSARGRLARRPRALAARRARQPRGMADRRARRTQALADWSARQRSWSGSRRSEEHTSELQSRQYLVCRLLLEKKKTYNMYVTS